MAFRDDIPSYVACILALWMFLVALIVNPTSLLARLLFFGLISTAFYCSFLWITPTYPFIAYLNGCQIAFSFLRVSDFLFLGGGERKIQGQKTPTHDLSFPDKIRWGWQYAFNVRWIGWEDEPHRVISPRPKRTTRTRFVLWQFLKLIGYTTILDICTLPVALRPPVSGDPWLTSSYPLVWRYTLMLVTIIIAYVVLNIAYAISSIIMVIFKFSMTDEWPSFFGPIAGTYSLRRFWGRTWHQSFRVVLLNHAKFLTDKILPGKGRISQVAQLYLVFYLSGLIHEIGEYAVHRHWAGKSTRFFLLQAVGITLEGILGISPTPLSQITGNMGELQKNDPSKRDILQKKWIGYLWVVFYGLYTAPFFVDRGLSIVVREETVYFSVMMGLIRGEWFPNLGKVRT